VRAKVGSAPQISKWLSGNIQSASLKTINRLVDYFECDKHWLATGDGEPFPQVDHPAKVGKKNPPGFERVVATINRPQVNRKENGTDRGEDHQTKTDPEFKTSDLIVMMLRVIESDTVYRPALASNVRAFYQATSGSEEHIDESTVSPTEMMLKTGVVLESPTIYRAALLSNILAFHQAVEGEGERKMMREEIDMLKLQLSNVVDRLDNVEKKVEVEPDQPTKKREAI